MFCFCHVGATSMCSCMWVHEPVSLGYMVKEGDLVGGHDVVAEDSRVAREPVWALAGEHLGYCLE